MSFNGYKDFRVCISAEARALEKNDKAGELENTTGQTCFDLGAAPDTMPPVVWECDSALESYDQPPLELRLLRRVLVYSFGSGKLNTRCSPVGYYMSLEIVVFPGR